MTICLNNSSDGENIELSLLFLTTFIILAPLYFYKIKQDYGNTKLANIISTQMATDLILADEIGRLPRKFSKYLFMRTLRQMESIRGEIWRAELDFLKQLQARLALLDEDINYIDNIMPYHLIGSLKRNNVIPGSFDWAASGVLLNGERISYAVNANLYAERVISRRQYNNRQYINRGMVNQTSGALFITNQRLYFNTGADYRQAPNIPLTQLLQANLVNGGLEVYKDKRQTGYYFGMRYGMALVMKAAIYHQKGELGQFLSQHPRY